jgi:hypothetical protein
MNPVELRSIKSFIALDIKPCSLFKDSGSFGGTCCFQPQLDAWFMFISCLAHSSIPTMEVTCPSETFVKFQRAVRH